jgi:hypothetical protein
MLQRFPNPRVEETGCGERQGDFAGAGSAPYLFGSYLELRGGLLTSIGDNHNHSVFARRWTRRFGYTIEVCNTGWVARLGARHRPIDVLYLDSLDTAEVRRAEHGLAGIETAYPRLRHRSLVICDDTVYRGDALPRKRGIAGAVDHERGRRVLYFGHQPIFVFVSGMR